MEKQEKLEKPRTGAYTEVQGNKRLTLDGCDGVIDFSDDQVVLRSGRLKITINGRDLRLRILTNSTAVTEGYISSIDYNYA